jgi:Protein of unknown function (DUF998)
MTISNATMTASRRKTMALLVCGVIAGPLFVLTFLVEGTTRAHYNPLRHPVSSLALGRFGWVQDANFIVAGLLTLAFAVGVLRALRPGQGATWGPLLIGVWALGLIGAGIFVTDPVSGYPPGTPDMLVEYGSVHAALHDYVSLPGFVSLVAACFVFTRRFARMSEPGWAIYSAASGVVFLIAFWFASAAFAQTESLVDFGGLFQRVMIVTGWTWLTLLAVHLLTARPQVHDPVRVSDHGQP